MKFKDFIEEEYLGLFRSRFSKHSFEVFENPSSKEIMETGRVDGSIRWIVYDKYVYIWPGHEELHENVVPLINNEFKRDIKFFKSIFGVGIPRAGKIYIPEDMIINDITIMPNKLKLDDWKFANRFFFNNDFIGLIRKRASMTSYINED
jgi:hypothetical protein